MKTFDEQIEDAGGHTDKYHGKFCSCGNYANHKVVEDGDFVFDKPGQVVRQPFTAYVCCRCFSRLFGPVAAEWCDRVTIQRADLPLDK